MAAMVAMVAMVATAQSLRGAALASRRRAERAAHRLTSPRGCSIDTSRCSRRRIRCTLSRADRRAWNRRSSLPPRTGRSRRRHQGRICRTAAVHTGLAVAAPQTVAGVTSAGASWAASGSAAAAAAARTHGRERCSTSTTFRTRSSTVRRVCPRSPDRRHSLRHTQPRGRPALNCRCRSGMCVGRSRVRVATVGWEKLAACCCFRSHPRSHPRHNSSASSSPMGERRGKPSRNRPPSCLPRTHQQRQCRLR